MTRLLAQIEFVVACLVALAVFVTACSIAWKLVRWSREEDEE